MKRQYLLIPLFALIFGACGEKDEIGPIQGEKNWLIVKDSDDPVDHKRFEIYDTYKVPVYYNDTIGSETRYDMSGEPYTHYERLQVFYNPGNSSVGGRFTLVENKNDIVPVLDCLKDELLPIIPQGFYIPSILLVDTLAISGSTDSTSFKGFNTIVCGKTKEFSQMNPEQQQLWKGGVMAGLLINGLMNNASEWLEKSFFQLSLDACPESDKVYSTTSSNLLYQALLDPAISNANKKLGMLGFLNFRLKAGEKEYMAKVPTRTEDLRQFCEAIFAWTQEEFEAKWGEWPVVMAKYEVLKGKLRGYGFEF